MVDHYKEWLSAGNWLKCLAEWLAGVDEWLACAALVTERVGLSDWLNRCLLEDDRVRDDVLLSYCW